MVNIHDEINVKDCEKQVGLGKVKKLLVKLKNEKSIKSWYMKMVLEKYEKRLEEYKSDKEELTDKKANASNAIMTEVYERRLKSVESKINIVTKQITAASNKYNKVQMVKKSRAITLAAGPISMLVSFGSWLRKKFKKFRKSNDDEKEMQNIKEESNDIAQQINSGFENIQAENNKPEQQMNIETKNDEQHEADMNSNQQSNDTKNTNVEFPNYENSQEVEKNNQQNINNESVNQESIQRPRDRGPYETDQHYVQSLREFYKKQFPDIDIEPVSSQNFAVQDFSNIKQETPDQIIDRVVGISDVDKKVGEMEEIPVKIDNIKDNSYNIQYSDMNTQSSIKNESDELRNLKIQLQELNNLIAGKERDVANKQAQLAEQEQSIRVEEQKNAQLFARVNELLKIKESKINSLSVEEQRANEKGISLNQRQAAIMEEQAALEMMLNEGTNQVDNDMRKTI